MAVDASTLLESKLSVPSELRTAEWSRLPQWLRERSFYMAGVHRAEILEAFRGEVAAIAAGQSGLEESRKRLGEFLTAANYQPLPGQEGTIKDLRTMRRIQTSLRTNVQLLQGWGQKNRGLAAQVAVPAWELVRYEGRKVPRGDWPARFERAGGTLHDGRMIALKSSPVWNELGNGEADSLGVDYPPFAWGSGMGWLGVRRAVAEQLGLLKDWKAPARQPLHSPNESLQSTPQISTRALRDALAERMLGLAEWRGDTLVFTDPNGSRPTTGEALVATWAKGMPEEFSDLPGGGLLQQASALDWFGDHEAFRDRNGTDAWDDLLRLAERTLSRPVDRLWRGMTMAAEKLELFLRGLDRDGYATRAAFPLESWTDSPSAAAVYARSGGKGWSVVLNVANPRAAADFSALVRAYSGQIAKQTTPPLVTESEWVYATGRKFKVLHVARDPATRRVQIELEELP